MFAEPLASWFRCLGCWLHVWDVQYSKSGWIAGQVITVVPSILNNFRFEDRTWTIVSNLHVPLKQLELREKYDPAERCCLKLLMLFQIGDLYMGWAQTIDHSGWSLWDSTGAVLAAKRISFGEDILFPLLRRGDRAMSLEQCLRKTF